MDMEIQLFSVDIKDRSLWFNLVSSYIKVLSKAPFRLKDQISEK